jgi:hypothetical protein
MEEWSELKNPVIPSRIETATLRVRYRIRLMLASLNNIRACLDRRVKHDVTSVRRPN